MKEVAYVKDMVDWHRPGIYVSDMPFVEGFQCLNEHIIVYTRRELFPQEKKFVRYHSKFKEATVLQDYMELNVGDYVVHHQHGVGRYMGIITRKEDGKHQDYLRIVYRGNDELLVPLSQFHLIRRFVSKEASASSSISLAATSGRRPAAKSVKKWKSWPDGSWSCMRCAAKTSALRSLQIRRCSVSLKISSNTS